MKVLALVLLATAVLAKHEQLQGWKSYYVAPDTVEKIKAFNTIADAFEGDVLSHPVLQRGGIVLVKPEHQGGFTNKLEELDISFKIHREDVKAALDADDRKIWKQNLESLFRNGGKRLPYDNYQELPVIYEYLEEIAKAYPNLVTLVEPGQSFDGRPIKYLKISTTNFEDESKPVIFIDGGIHAREWISPPTVTWAIHKLVENVTEPDLLEKFDWVLLPVVNPDGYAHTFRRERFWRKTRSYDNRNILTRLCPGVDGNRNFAFHWNTVGTQPSPCSDIYPGNIVFSEVETRVVRDIIHTHLHRMALYLTIHSFGSMVLYPWGNDGSLSNNALALHTVGVAMAREIDALSNPHFPRYIVGNAALVLNYNTSGSSEDYAHFLGVPLSYTIELPGLELDDEDWDDEDWDDEDSNGDGFEGFHLDPKYIKDVITETWAGIIVGARRAGELYQGIIAP